VEARRRVRRPAVGGVRCACWHDLREAPMLRHARLTRVPSSLETGDPMNCTSSDHCPTRPGALNALGSTVLICLILLVHPFSWPMRTVAETGLTQTALAAAALQRSL